VDGEVELMNSSPRPLPFPAPAVQHSISAAIPHSIARNWPPPPGSVSSVERFSTPPVPLPASHSARQHR
jgi:hypothetical protein